MQSKTYMKTMIFISLALCSWLPMSAQTDSLDLEILRMLELSGAEANYEVAMSQMFSMFKQQWTMVDSTTWNELEQEFDGAAISELNELLLPVYRKHLTLDEVRQLNAFYASPIGQTLTSKTPIIMQESMQVGQEWGIKIGQDFAKKMEERGY